MEIKSCAMHTERRGDYRYSCAAAVAKKPRAGLKDESSSTNIDTACRSICTLSLYWRVG